MIALKNESEVFLVNLVPVFFLQPMDGMIEEIILAGPRAVMHSDQVEQRRFACAGRSHDGNELSFLNVHVDAAKHERLGWTMFEVLLDIAQIDHNLIRMLPLVTLPRSKSRASLKC